MWTTSPVEELFPSGFCTMIRQAPDEALVLSGAGCPIAGMMEQKASTGSRFVMIGSNPANPPGVEAQYKHANIRRRGRAPDR
jgi:hypothetical protein